MEIVGNAVESDDEDEERKFVEEVMKTLSRTIKGENKP
jgi:hypothetical protein